MNKRILNFCFAALGLVAVINFSCTKFDTTDVGGDLIPVVDNVNTFAKELDVTATQGLFVDSTRIARGQDHVLGSINNDPLFGTTKANIYLQLKPPFFPYYFGNSKDTLNGFGAGLDSVVLCLNVKGFYGDSSVLQQLSLYQINDNTFKDRYDSTFKINYQPNIGTLLGSKSVDVKSLGNQMKYAYVNDSSKNQIRIKITNTAFINSLYNADSAKATNGAFQNDSLYRNLFNGLAIVASGSGNGLIYVGLKDTTTKLEVFYRKFRNGKVDTVYTSFKLSNTSSSANNLVRNRSGYPVSSPTSNEIYLQTTPGTFADLRIKQLDTFSNKIIHRAELIVQQIPSPAGMDNIFVAPGFLYVDLKDTTTGVDKWKPVYYDLNPGASYNPDDASNFYPGQVDFTHFGGYRRDKVDVFGTGINFYNFNLTRHVQQVVTKRTPNYNLRLFAPYEINYPQYFALIPYNNSLAFGRVKIGSGTNPNYKMILRIVYSNL